MLTYGIVVTIKGDDGNTRAEALPKGWRCSKHFLAHQQSSLHPLRRKGLETEAQAPAQRKGGGMLLKC